MTAEKRGDDVCAVPGCLVKLYDRNVTNVCREHMHSEHCACLQCMGGPKPKLHVRSRDELVKMGLLPKQRIFV